MNVVSRALMHGPPVWAWMHEGNTQETSSFSTNSYYQHKHLIYVGWEAYR